MGIKQYELLAILGLIHEGIVKGISVLRKSFIRQKTHDIDPNNSQTNGQRIVVLTESYIPSALYSCNSSESV